MNCSLSNKTRERRRTMRLLLALAVITLAAAPVESNREGHVRKHKDGKNKNDLSIEPKQKHGKHKEHTTKHKSKHTTKHKKDAIVEESTVEPIEVQESVIKESKREKHKKEKHEKKEKHGKKEKLHTSESIEIVDDEEKSMPEKGKGWRLWQNKEIADPHRKE